MPLLCDMFLFSCVFLLAYNLLCLIFINTTILTFFWLMLAWHVIFHPVTPNFSVHYISCISLQQYIEGCIFFNSIYLFAF